MSAPRRGATSGTVGPACRDIALRTRSRSRGLRGPARLWETKTNMTIRVMLLAGIVSLPLSLGAASAADSGKRTLVEAAKAGDRDALMTLLKGRAKEDVAGQQ